MAGVEEIFLSQVADVGTDCFRDVQVVVDDEAGVGAADDGLDPFRETADLIGRRIFGAQLDEVAPAIAQLLRDEFGRAAMKVGRVDEGVQFAIHERFHEVILTTKYTKYTKREFFRVFSVFRGCQKKGLRRGFGQGPKH